MKQGLTELVFILDRSGSMSGLEADTIGGYNSMLTRQQQEPGEAVVTTVLFDDQYELLHDRIRLPGVAPITGREYFVRGSTALLDAIGRTVNKITNVVGHTAEAERPEKVLFVITTDGMENASREYTYEKVRQMIEQQKASHGWEFLFLGANIDAIGTAAKFGIAADRAVDVHADSLGTSLQFAAVCSAASALRSSGAIREDWKQDIEEDTRRRKRV